MKKITVLLTVLIILSHISTCSFAYEATEDEQNVYYFALQFLNKFDANAYLNTDYDLSNDTIARFDDNSQMKSEILEKAKEYEDEIRNNHFYRYHEDNAYIQEKLAEECDENGGCPPPAPDAYKQRWPAKQYDSTAIEDVISSFPVFIEKKCQYLKAIASHDTSTTRIDYKSLFTTSPRRVTVSESGFAYVTNCTCYVLLYRYQKKSSEEYDWIVCDVSIFYDDYDYKYRFHSEDLDVEELILSKGYTLTSENEDTDTDTATNTNTDPTEESNNEAQNSPSESKPTNYIPWVICGIETVLIIAVAIAYVLKKKK